ncbi:MAG: hypothetical protein WC952_12680 [Desulfobulbaceae bacterium]
MSPASKTCRPCEHLRAAAYYYQQAWKQLDMFRAERGTGGLPDWPEWCYCPMAGAYAVVSGGGNGRCDMDTIGDVARIAALSAWRMTQGIYRFDPALYARLIETPVGRLPVDVLYRLPEWCVYIETPDLQWLGSRLAGFFAHLEWDANSGRPELRLLLDIDDEQGPRLVAQPLHLTAATLEEAMAAALAESGRQMINQGRTRMYEAMPADLAPTLARPLEPLLSLLLYLCSEAADFGGRMPPALPQPTKTKKGLKIFPPSAPRRWDVGVRIGAALRRAYSEHETGGAGEPGESGRARPRPHVRRAHWHSYWTGPRDGERQAIVKWIPPVPVNVDDIGDLPATVRPVK